MKKRIIAIIAGVAVAGVALFQAIPALAQTTDPLREVVINPTSTTLGAGGVQQFTAQAYDSGNHVISNVIYYWLLTAGGGILAPNGNTATFTAGVIPGTYADTVEVIAIQGKITKVATVTVKVTGIPGAFDHVTIIPDPATMLPGGTQQFIAQAYDVNNIAISGFSYTWSVVNGGGSINMTSGLFIADTATGTFPNTVKVATVPLIGNSTDTATVIVKQNAEPTPTPRIGANALLRLFNGYLKNIGFDSFLGGQWQIKDNGVVKTIKVIPGIVQAVPAPSTSSISIIPNGQSIASPFTLLPNTIISPKGVTFAANDKVVIVTVNDQVVMVAKVVATTSNQLPPGLRKQGDDKREGKLTPPGWSKGNKSGWSQGDSENNNESEND